MAIKARAQQNLTKVFDGSGVFSIILTNENTSIPISNQGLALNYTATPSDVYVYSGTSLLTPVASNPEPGEYTITASGENITAGVVSYNGNHASISNASDFVTDKQTYSITFTASGKDFLGNPFTSQKKQVITALRHGDDATSYWVNTTASVVMKDVNDVLQPSTVMASAVSQEGFANATPYKGIFKIYIKTGVAFPTTPAYTSSAPEVSHTVNLDTTMNDIRIDMYSADGTNLLDTQTVPVIAQANGVISTAIQYTVTDTNVQPTESASWADTIPTVGIGQFLWTKTTFYYTDGSNAVAYSMGHVGKDGASAPLLFLSSDSQAFTFDGAGNPSPVNQTITFVANLQNLTGTATFVATPYLDGASGTPISLGGTGNMRTLSVAQFGQVYDSVSVKASLGNLTDTETVYKLKDGADGGQGAQGVQGPKGPDGLTTYVHIAYANSSNGSTGFSTTDPTGKAYIGVYTDTSVPDSTDYTKYTWSLIKGADGVQGPQGATGTQGPKGADGLTTYVHVAYANSADGATNFSTTDPTGKAYIGVLTDTSVPDSTDYTKYTWSLVKGADGANGSQGIPGPKGADGLTTYVHFVYAGSADGKTNFSTTDPTGRPYLGVMTDTTSADSTDPTKYTWSLIQGATGPQGNNGATGPKGADGLTTYVHVAYANSADGSLNFSTTDPTGNAYIGVLTDTSVPDSTDYTKYTWSLVKGADGANGSQGIPGPKGADGLTTYVHFVYAGNVTGTSNFSTTDPSGRPYMGVMTDTTPADSTDPTKYTWSLTQGIQGIQGPTGSAGATGPKGADGLTTYVHVAYANSSDGSTLFSTTDPSGRAYIGVLTDTSVPDSTDYTKYTWSLVKGADGANGSQGIPGPKGADGLTTYVHFAYATNSMGSTGFSTTDPVGKTYLGVYTDTTPADSTNATLYTWSLMQGPQGPQGANGVQGAKGADGLTTYVHVAYANSADGSTLFSTTDPSGRGYIGVLTDTSVPDSTDYTKYTWSLVKGADGANGAQGIQGPKGSDGISTYIHFAYANSADGSTGFSTTDPTNKAYIGVYTDTTSADSMVYTKYTWSLIKGPTGSAGPQGIPGPTGPNGVSTYVHFAYANSSDGTVGFSTTANNQTYIGVYTDSTQTGSTTPSMYTWSLMKGADGKNAITGWLTNESITLQADSNGNVPSYTSATGSFVVYNGLTQVTGLTVNQANAVGMTLSISGMNYSVTNMVADIAYVDMSVTYSGTTITKRLTLAKSKAGANGANGTSVVNSTTPPTNPTVGQWWNDMSVTPNVLKVYQSGNWIPYRIDAINLVAQSVTTDKLATNVLVASNVTYTNKNGTSTNLQTFNFDGIQTLLSDGNGNVYTSMDNAVSSTQTWKGLNTKVNSLGQINQIVNSEFTPDFSGWMTESDFFLGRINPSTPYLSLDQYSYNQSNIVRVDTRSLNFTPIVNQPIKITPQVGAISFSAYISTVSGYSGRVSARIRFYDSNKVYISASSGSTATSNSSMTYVSDTVYTIPTGAVYVAFVIGFDNNDGVVRVSKPMMVFGSAVGAYAPGNYNNNQSVAEIKAQADKIELSVSNMAVGGRNLFLNSKALWAPTLLSGSTSVSIVSLDDTTNMWHITAPKSSTSTIQGIYFNQGSYSSSTLQVNQNWAMSADIKGTGVYSKVGVNGSSNWQSPIGSVIADWSRVTATGTMGSGTNINLYFDVTSSPLDVYIKLPKLETGTFATDYTEAPEDVSAWTQSQIKLTAEQINIGVNGTKNIVDKLQSGGTNLLAMANTTRGWLDGSYNITSPGDNSLASDFIPVTPGSSYVAQQWFDAPHTAGAGYIRYAFYDANKKPMSRFPVPATGSSYSKWSITAPAGVSYIRFSLDNFYGGMSHAKFEVGDVPTPWTPAPQDLTGLQTYVNSLGQGNLVTNSEFSPDLAGWYIRGTNSLLATPTVSFSGVGKSNAVLLDTTNGTGTGNVNYTSAMYPVQPDSTLSVTVQVSSSVTGVSPLIGFIYYDANKNAIAGMRGNISIPVADTYSLYTYTGSPIPSTARYVSFDFLIPAANKAKYMLSQPLMVYGATPGTYVQGQYNTYDAVTVAQSTANTASSTASSAQSTANTASSTASSALARANSLGQINQLFNTEFSPDFQGWYSGNSPMSGAFKQGTDLSKDTSWALSQSKYNGSNILYHNVGTGNNSFFGDLIPVGPGIQIMAAITAISDAGTNSTVTAAIYLRYYDANKNYISQDSVNSVLNSTWAQTTINSTTPANTAYVSYNLLTNGSTGINRYTQPMLVFDNKIGTYVQGNYNNNKYISDVSTGLNFKLDSYTLGTTVDGKLVSGFTGNQRQLTIKGNMVTLDSDTVVAKDFIAKNIKTDNLSSISATLGDVTSGSITNPINQAWSAGTGTTLLGTTVIDKRGINMNADIKTASNPKVYSETLSISPDTGIKFSWRDYSGGTSLPPIPLDVTVDRNGLVALSGKYSSVVGGDSISVNNGRDGTAASFKAAATSDSGMGGVSAGGVTTSDYIRYVTPQNDTQNLPLVMGLERIGNMVMVSFNFTTYGSTIRADQLQMNGPKIPVGFRPVDNVHIQANANNSGNHIAVITFTITPDGRVLQTSPAINGGCRIMGSGFYLTYMVGGGPGSIIVDAQGNMS